MLFSDLLLWGWLRRRRVERRLLRADALLARAATADPQRKQALLRELGAALDADDPYLYGHSLRVARYATMTARRLGLPDDQVARVQAAAAIHDIGKLRIPGEILHKPGRLTDAEFAVTRRHCAEGGAIVAAVLGDAELAAIVRAHHERFDGGGYPDGLTGEAIPL